MPTRKKYTVKKHITKQQLQKMIKQKEKEALILKRLYFIRLLYDGHSVEDASDKIGIVKATGYNWLKRWNKGKFKELCPNFGGGRPPKLTINQKTKLKDLLIKQDTWTTKNVKDLIEDHFGVSYSEKQIMRILRAMGMNYGKPFPRDYRRPIDAENILKKTKEES
jgi:putative transposase